MMLWVASPSLAGVCLSGNQRSSDLRLAHAVRAQVFGPPHRRALFCDIRRFRTDDLSIFEAMLSAPRATHTRASVLLPDGWSRAWWLGAFAMGALNATPARVFTDPAEGWAWVGGAEPLRLELYAHIARPSNARAPLSALEALLRVEPSRDLESSARALGLSSRSLQRTLRQAGATFGDVRDRARAEIASARLVQSDDKVDSVAADTGFRSRSHFIAWFRRLTGLSPAAFREHHRATGSHCA
jgi:AraC-like DNA-binding protein